MQERSIRFLSGFAAIMVATALCPAIALAQTDNPDAQQLVPTTLETQATPIAEGTWGTCSWDISGDGTLTVHPGMGPDSSNVPWTIHKDSIKKVVFATENDKKVVALNCMYLLEGLTNVTSVDLKGLDTSKVKNMFDMFAGCTSLQSIDITSLDVSRAENMSSMFAGCTSLKNVNLSGLKATNATNMSYMFSGCTSLVAVDLSAFDTPNLEGLDGMFEACANLPYVDLSSLSTSQVTSINGLFAGCSSLESANLAGLQTPELTNMRYLFYECAKLRYVDLSSFDTSKVTDTGDMFAGCASLAGISLGPKVTKLGQLPANLLDSGQKWYSRADGKWYTIAEILTKRLGMADDYTTFDPATDTTYDLSKATVTVSPASYVYDGTEKKPSVTVKLGNEVVPSWGYNVSYKDNVKAGTATATATGRGLYHGEASATFSIAEAPAPDNGNGGNGGNGGGGNSTNNGGNGGKGGTVKSDLASYLGKAKAAGFTDLDPNAWYMKVPDGAFPDSNTLYLDYTIARGLMSGYSGTTLFGPDDALDRGMAATIIYRMATGQTAKTTNNNVNTKFSDVPAGQWYSAAVAWCAENGVVTGYSGTTLFGPGDPVTREQLATMIARYCMKVENMPTAGTDLSRFPDQGSVSDWAREGVAFCAAKAVVSGYSHNGNFGPQDGATRCQMSKIIAVTARMLE